MSAAVDFCGSMLMHAACDVLELVDTLRGSDAADLGELGREVFQELLVRGIAAESHLIEQVEEGAAVVADEPIRIRWLPTHHLTQLLFALRARDERFLRDLRHRIVSLHETRPEAE